MLVTLSISETISEIIISIGEGIGNALTWLFSFLPDDPINLQDTIFNIPLPVQNALSFVNWFVPVADCLLLISAWIVVILSIWFVRVFLKIIHFV